MIRYYRLIGKLPVPCDVIESALWMKRNSNVVKQTQVGPLFVSTVFLAIDHNFVPGREPLLFETMIFDGDDDGYQARATTWDVAEKNHEEAVKVAETKVELASKFLMSSKE